jgi:hypothetical protein
MEWIFAKLESNDLIALAAGLDEAKALVDPPLLSVRQNREPPVMEMSLYAL